MRKGVLTMVLAMVLAVGCSDTPNSVGTTSPPDGTGTSEPTDGGTSPPDNTATSVPTDGGTSPPDNTATSVPTDRGTSPPDNTATSEPTGEPAPEPTAPESTQTKKEQPSIKIASLPIGGSAGEDDPPNCNPVSFLGNSIPAGVTIKLGAPYFDPKHIFEVDHSPCSGHPACAGTEWTSDHQDICYVRSRQVADTGHATLVVPAKATCASEAGCADLRRRMKADGGSQIDLTAQPPETTEAPSETVEIPSETVETPPETPASETPSSG